MCKHVKLMQMCCMHACWMVDQPGLALATNMLTVAKPASIIKTLVIALQIYFELCK